VVSVRDVLESVEDGMVRELWAAILWSLGDGWREG
jgi:hypothetical protein